MTGPEHYLEAERLLDVVGQVDSNEIERRPTLAALLVTRAQVHATLAHAAAVALAIDPTPEAVAEWDPLLLTNDGADGVDEGDPEPQCGIALAPGIHCIRTEFEDDGRHPGDGFHEDGRGNRWAP